MKKFAVFALAAVMIICFACSAFADSLSGGSADVTAEYVSGESNDVYSADITWGSLEFTYCAEETTWNPETHSYEVSAEAYWACEDGADEVTVTNHSSKAIVATLSYTPDESYSSVTGSFDNSVMTIAAPEEGSDYAEAPFGVATLTVSGALAESAEGSVKIGTVEVALAAANGDSVSSGSGGEQEPSAAVGYLSLFTRDETDTTDIRYDIYAQSETVYTAEFTVEEVISDSSLRPDTLIHINGTDYYIYEPHSSGACYEFAAGIEAHINTTPYIEETTQTDAAKITVVEAGKTYILTVDLEAMTATLAEV